MSAHERVPPVPVDLAGQLGADVGGVTVERVPDEVALLADLRDGAPTQAAGVVGLAPTGRVERRPIQRHHPVAAQLFMNHLLDAKVSAKNTNYIGYMGPNAAAKEFIKPYILKDPAVNPDQAVVESLVELLDLGTDLDKYASRWTTLRSGA